MKNIDIRLSALRSELDALQENIKDLAGNAGDAANDRVHHTMRAAENVAERAFRLAEESTAHLADDVETWANENLDSVRETVRAQPLSSVVLSMGVGAILGAIFMRR